MDRKYIGRTSVACVYIHARLQTSQIFRTPTRRARPSALVHNRNEGRIGVAASLSMTSKDRVNNEAIGGTRAEHSQGQARKRRKIAVGGLISKVQLLQS